MSKIIILKDRGAVEMTFEEVLKQFERMIERFARLAIEKIVYNKPEKEELLQELRLQVWEAYRRYNGENAFSTYLHYRLKHGIHRGTVKSFAQKRINEAGTTSLNEIVGGDGDELELEGLIGEEDLELTSLDFREFVMELEKKLDENEKKILKVLMDKQDFSVQDLADQLRISRQAANKKVNKFREKLEKIMKETGYVPFDIIKLQAV